MTLALGLVMSSYLVAQHVRPLSLWISHIPLSMMCICLTGSRGGVLAMGVGLLMIPAALARLPRDKRWLFASSLAVLVAVAAMQVPSATWDRLSTIQSEVSEGTLTNRTRIWSAGLEVFREHPLTGVGFGAFGESVYSRLDIVYVAHNSYLSVLVELGLIGELIFFATLASSFYLASCFPQTVRIFWLVLLATWCVSVSSLTWEHRKPTWFLFGLVIAQSNVYSHLSIRAPASASPSFSPRVNTGCALQRRTT